MFTLLDGKKQKCNNNELINFNWRYISLRIFKVFIEMIHKNDTTSLYFFTISYPFGTGEEFVEDELNILSGKFHKIYIFPLYSTEKKRSIPENAEVINWEMEFKYSRVRMLLKNWILFSTIFLYEFIHSKNKINFLRYIFEMKSLLIQNFARAESIAKNINNMKGSQNIFYSFWYEDWATVLGILKEKNVITRYFSRVHGFELYSERRKYKLIPFRNFQLKTVEKVFSVSKVGMNYLKQKYPFYSSKIKLSYLGTAHIGNNPLNEQARMTLVSCASLISLKRIDLIVQILKNCTIDISWIHFGDGILKENLLEKMKELPKNISVEFKGHISNPKIKEFYKNQSVNLFISVSETEGLPVSMMEAISFGIPIMATNVGGVSEIVNEKTGVLLPLNIDIMATAKLIDEFNPGKMNTEEFRAGVRKFWAENFVALENYKDFASELLRE